MSHWLTGSMLNAAIAAWQLAPGLSRVDGTRPAWNAWWLGAVVLVLAAGRLTRVLWQSWVTALAGATLLSAAFWLEQSAAAFWNDVACGAAILLLALVGASNDDGPVAAAPWYRR